MYFIASREITEMHFTCSLVKDAVSRRLSFEHWNESRGTRDKAGSGRYMAKDQSRRYICAYLKYFILILAPVREYLDDETDEEKFYTLLPDCQAASKISN